MPVSLIINRTVSFFSDQDEIGQFDPGDVIYTRVTIQNTGDTAATGVQISDNFASDTAFGVSTNAATLNVSPIAFNDTFQAIGNTVLRVDDTDAGIASINGGISTYVQGNLLSNDRGSSTVGSGIITGDARPGFTIDVTPVGGGTSANGGKFNIFADGSFNYVNDGSDVLVSGKLPTDSFTYTIRDVGLDNVANTADDLTSVATVTITFAEQAPGANSHRVWYVDSSAAAGGDGTSARPFNTLDVSQINGAGGSGDIDSAGEYIYVRGTHTANFVLEAGQDLIGGGSALIVAGITLANAGTQATLRHSGTGVTLSTDNVIAGLNIDGTAQGAVGIADGNTTVGTLSISNVGINVDASILGHNQGQILDIDQGGTVSISLNSMRAIGSTGANGGVVQLTGVNGSLTVSGTTQIIGTHSQSGIVVSNGTGAGGVDVTLGGTVEIHSGAQSAIAFTGNGAGSSLTLSGGTKNIDTSDVDAVVITNNTSSTVTVSGTTLDVSTGTSGAGDAIDIQNNNGLTMSVTSNLIASAGTGTAINIQNNTGTNSITFSGTSKDIDATTGAGAAGINMTGNSAGTSVTFSNGGLDVDTTGGRGITATGNNAGTLIITGGTNSISSAAGVALNVANTTIGAGGLNFVRVDSNGSSSGIILNTTGATAGLTITGTGSAGSGGTIQNTTDSGIKVNGSANLNLSWVNITNHGTAPVATADPFLTEGHGIELLNLSGVNTISNVAISMGNHASSNGVHINNNNVNLGGLTINALSVTGNNTGLNNDGVFMEAWGTSSMALKIDNSSFTRMFGDGVQVNGLTGATGTVQVTIEDSSFTNAKDITASDVNGGQGGISLNPLGSITFRADVNNNTFTDTNRPITNVGAIGMTSGHFAVADITIRNNTLTDINGGRGITATIDGGTTELLIDNNNINQLGSSSKYAISVNSTFKNADANVGATVGNVDVTIVNNDIGQTGPLWTDAGGGDVEAIFLNVAGGASMDALVASNFVTANTIVEVLRARASGTGSLEVAINNNTITDTLGSHLEINGTVGTISTDPGGTLVMSISGNTLPGGGVGVIGFSKGVNGTPSITVQQLNSATLSAVNSGATVNGSANATFNGPAPTAPTTPTLPSSPLLAEAPPSPEETLPEVPADHDPGEIPNPPAADSNGGSPVVEDGVLSQAELDLIVDAAIQRWADAGATADQIAAMRAVSVSVSNLGGLTLGSSDAGTITLDDDAAGWRWFVDATPGDDSEYAGAGTRLAAADRYSLAGTRIDLLTVVTHELGHQIGLSDSYDAGDRDELMYGTVGAGERRLAGSNDLDGAGGAAVSGAFAVAPIDIGTLPAGQTVTIEWRSVVNNPTGAAEDRPAPYILGQTTVTGDNFSVVLSDANAGLAGNQAYMQQVDAVRLSGFLYTDIAKDGDFDAGTDTILSGVTLLLFADTNNDGNYDEGTDLAVVYQDANNNNVYDAGDTPLAAGSTGAGVKQMTATSALVTGGYSFTNLAPGDYIVVVPASNFGAAPLGNRIAHGTPADPNNNQPLDNNAEQFLAGQAGLTYAATLAIRLDYGLENAAGPAGTALDTNDTLALGFDNPNQPPAIGALHGDSVTHVEGLGATPLDNGANATVTDGDSLDGNFGGGTLTAQVTGNRIDAEDTLLVKTGGNITVDLLNSKINYSNVEMATFTGGTGGAPLVITFNATATIARVQELMRLVAYENADDATPDTTVRTVTLTLVDGDGRANGGDDDVSVVTTVSITAVNDAPTGTDNEKVINEDAPYTFVYVPGGANDFGFNDVDGDTFAGVRITELPAAGTLTLNNVAVVDEQVIAAADIQAGLLKYTPALNASGDDYATFSFKVIDTGSNVAPNANEDDVADPFTFDVTAVNDVPAIANLQGDNVGYIEGGAPLFVDAGGNASVSDPDSADFDTGTLTVEITANEVAAEDVLAPGEDADYKIDANLIVYQNSVIIANWSGPTIGAPGDPLVLTFRAAATASHVAAIMRLVNYENTNQINPSTAQRTLTWTLTDGDGATNAVTSTIAVTGVNDRPSAADKTIAVAEDGSYTLLVSDFGFTDPDGNGFQSVYVNGVSGDGDLKLNGVQVVTGQYIQTADIASGLLVFTPDPNTSGDAYGQLNFQVFDDGGTNNGGINFSLTSRTIAFNVGVVNDAPVLDLDGAGGANTAVGYLVEQDPAGTGNIAPAATVSDSDSANFETGTLVVGFTANAEAGDLIELPAFSGDATHEVAIDGAQVKYNNVVVGTYAAGDHDTALSITFNDQATAEAVQWVVRGVRVLHTGDAPSTAVRTLNYALTDGDGGSTNANATVNVQPDNDAPASTAPTNAAIGFAENAGVSTPLMQGVVLSDVDLPANFAGGSLNLNVSGGEGGINLKAGSLFSIVADGVGGHNLVYDNAGTPVIVGKIAGFGTSNMTVSAFTAEATLARLNDLVDDFGYILVGDNPTPGDKTVTMTFNDGNNSGGGANVAKTTVETQTLTVTVANDVPLLDLDNSDPSFDSAVAYSENAATVLLAPNAAVSDPDDANIEAATVSITAGRVAGDALTLNGLSSGNTGTGGAIAFSYDSTTGILTLTGTASKADYQAALRLVGFSSTSDSPGTSRTIGWTLNDGTDSSAARTTVVTVTPSEDLPVAQNDSDSTTEAATKTIAILTNDSDADGPPPAVEQIDGQAIAAGETITLSGSGAKVTLNNDGTITYDPNGKFNTLTAPGSGAVNTSALDSFTYKLAGTSATATVEVTVNGLASADDRLKGDSGDNVITGTPQRDIFELQQGGNDTVYGLAGNDTFYFGAAFTAADTVDAGEGADAVILQGNYNITLGTGLASNIQDLESFSLAPGNNTTFGDTAGNFYDYSFTTLDSNVAAGAVLKFNGFLLRAGEDLTVNGSAETDGKFIILAGLGVDNLTGGAQNDVFIFGHDGRFGNSDVVNGGGGYDSIYLRGDYSIDFNSAGYTGVITGIESITLGGFADARFTSGGDGEFDYVIVWNNAMLATGATITLNGSTLGAAETMSFNGSSESGANFRLFGGAAGDTLTGGSGNDLFYGGLGWDNLTGNGGADTFRYQDVTDSGPTPGTFDMIFGFTHLVDKIDLSMIDANANAAGDQAFSFIGSSAFAGGGASAGQLRAVLIDAPTNTWQIEGDTNGDGTPDLLIRLTVEAGQPLTAPDFIL